MITPQGLRGGFQRQILLGRLRRPSHWNTIADLLPRFRGKPLIIRGVWAGPRETLCDCSAGVASSRSVLPLQLSEQRPERLLRELYLENPLDLLPQPLSNPIEPVLHQVRPPHPHIGLNLGTELAVGLAPFQNPDQLIRVVAAQGSTPPLNRLGINVEGLLQHSPTHPRIGEPPHQHLEIGIVPFG